MLAINLTEEKPKMKSRKMYVVATLMTLEAENYEEAAALAASELSGELTMDVWQMFSLGSQTDFELPIDRDAGEGHRLVSVKIK
jgi:hypothetical protein